MILFATFNAASCLNLDCYAVGKLDVGQDNSRFVKINEVVSWYCHIIIRDYVDWIVV